MVLSEVVHPYVEVEGADDAVRLVPPADEAGSFRLEDETSVLVACRTPARQRVEHQLQTSASRMTMLVRKLVPG